MLVKALLFLQAIQWLRGDKHDIEGEIKALEKAQKTSQPDDEGGEMMYSLCRLDVYELLNRTSPRIVRVAAASRLVHEFQIMFSPKVKIKDSTSLVHTVPVFHSF